MGEKSVDHKKTDVWCDVWMESYLISILKRDEDGNEDDGIIAWLGMAEKVKWKNEHYSRTIRCKLFFLEWHDMAREWESCVIFPRESNPIHSSINIHSHINSGTCWLMGMIMAWIMDKRYNSQSVSAVCSVNVK